MKELFKDYEHKKLDEVNSLVLLDTCFIIDLMNHHEKWDLLPDNLGITSFNADEICFVEHRLSGVIKKKLRKFFKQHDFLVVDVPVHPGDWEAEKVFVNSVDPRLLSHVADASDAVLMAVGIKTRSTILTKDKHHLFTVGLENFLEEYGLRVFKNLHEL